MTLGALGNMANDMIAATLANKAINVQYRHHRAVAIATGIVAILALIAAVAISIFFPPASAIFSVVVPLTAIACTVLGCVAIYYGIQAGRLQQAANILR